MDNFINAERQLEKGHRKVIKNHFGNNDLCKLFSLPVIHHSHHHSAPVINWFCCNHCAPCQSNVCCDLCDPTHISFPLALNPFQKPAQRAMKFNPKLYIMGDNENHLCNALIKLRIKLADKTLSQRSFLAPQILLSMKLLDRIVDLAHHHKILNFNSLCDQISQAFLDSHGSKIVDLVHKFFPPPSLSLFTNTPLQPYANTSNQSMSLTRPPNTATWPIKCRVCGGDGYNRELHYMVIISEFKYALQIQVEHAMIR